MEDHARYDAAWTALCRSQAVIEFTPEGVVMWANPIFCEATGYTLDEIQGQHHRIFCDPEFVQSDAYHAFWKRLKAGHYEEGVFRRTRRDGDPVYLKATYNPVFDEAGVCVRILKIASDVTQEHYRVAEVTAKLAAIDRSQAVIEFTTDGHIIDANDNFLAVVGYDRSEIIGQHHRIFCTEEEAQSEAYAAFWQRLGSGSYDAGTYRRRTRDNRDIWLQATYNPVLDIDGKPLKVVKFATDITAETVRAADVDAKLAAIDRSQAVIEFATDGTIIDANENFLQVMGYRHDEIVGKHHRIFCDPDVTRGQDYADFWKRLGEGVFDSGTYRRQTKSGSEVWLQATYNPVLSPEGAPLKIVKFASDVTEAKQRHAEAESRIAAIDHCQSVVEYDLTGHIVSANENSLPIYGFSRAQMVGQHHRMLCDPPQANSIDYGRFWDKLRHGDFEAGRYQRVNARGQVVWIQAAYHPIYNIDGRPTKIVEIATDITNHVMLEQDLRDKIDEGQQLKETIGLQAQLEDNMNELSAIVATISNIAAQTRILALNATIEAARAGDEGSGFAVVAGEVKRLADHTRMATEEASKMLERRAA